MSEYITATFFGGDIGLLSSKDPTKLASFRALCQREDLQMGVSTLNRLVRIGHQVRQFPAELAENLTPGHHRALLSVEPVAHKEKLARQAVKSHWTAQQLEKKIAAEKPPTKHPGRPHKPDLLKWLAELERVAGKRDNAKAFAFEFAELAETEQAALVLDLAAVYAALGRLLQTAAR